MENAKSIFNSDKIEYCQSKYEVLDGADALILITEWKEFRSPNFEVIEDKLKNKLIFDGRNQYDYDSLKEQGFTYCQIGVHDC